MRAVVPPADRSYPYAGTGYANLHAVTQIANGTPLQINRHVFIMSESQLSSSLYVVTSKRKLIVNKPGR
jgi:hypothetical protein